MSPEQRSERRSEQRKRAGGGGRVRFLHRRWQALVFAVLASALSLAAYWFHPEFLENLDQRSRDVAFRWRDPLPPTPDVAIIAVDEASLHEYGRWPWPRSVQARLIDRLTEYGPRVIALDIVYAQPSNEACNCDEQDDMLKTALAADGAIIIGGYFFRPKSSGKTEGEARDLLYANRIKQKLIRAGGRLDVVPEWPFVQTSQAEFAREMTGLGFFNRHTDIDGLVRTVPLVMRYDGEIYPSLALRALAAWRGEEPGIVADSTGITEIRLGDAPIPVDEQGRMTANFYDLERGLPIYSAADVLGGRLEADVLRNRLLFVGVTETGVGDLVPTPVHGQFPGVAVHATAAGNIIQQSYLYKDLGTVLYDVALIALIPLVSIMLMAFMGKLSHMIVAMVFFSALLAGVFYFLVTSQSQLVSLIYPAAALILAFTTYQVYFMLTSQRTTRFLTGAFSSYVSPDVVDRLLLTPESLGLSGEEREVTVLFSDIRSFTTLSEQLEPARLVDFLNEFFDHMTAIILEHQGTLDKFIGDAIMALFNAPLNIEDHQKQAARAALGMIRRLAEIRPDYETRFGTTLDIGIGIHSGKAVVGNLGSSQRFDYTAVGDAVNLASRVESISKYYGVPIIHTAQIDTKLDGSFLRRPLDRIRVKGKSEHAQIFQLMVPDDDQRSLSEGFTAALQDYFAQRFEAAGKQFEQLLLQFPEDRPAMLMHARCVEFASNPPPGDWDGVYQAETK